MLSVTFREQGGKEIVMGRKFTGAMIILSKKEDSRFGN